MGITTLGERDDSAQTGITHLRRDTSEQTGVHPEVHGRAAYTPLYTLRYTVGSIHTTVHTLRYTPVGRHIHLLHTLRYTP